MVLSILPNALECLTTHCHYWFQILVKTRNLIGKVLVNCINPQYSTGTNFNGTETIKKFGLNGISTGDGKRLKKLC